MRGSRVKALRRVLNEKIPTSMKVPGFLRHNAWRRLKASHKRGDTPYQIKVGPPAGYFPEHSTTKFDGSAKRAKLVNEFAKKIAAREKEAEQPVLGES